MGEKNDKSIEPLHRDDDLPVDDDMEPGLPVSVSLFQELNKCSMTLMPFRKHERRT